MKIKESTLIQIVILILFVGIIEPTAFIGTWIHSLCGALRTVAFLVSVLLYLKDRTECLTAKCVMHAVLWIYG